MLRDATPSGPATIAASCGRPIPDFPDFARPHGPGRGRSRSACSCGVVGTPVPDVGDLGVVLPILPGVPFLLVAAFLLGRSSPDLRARVNDLERRCPRGCAVRCARGRPAPVPVAPTSSRTGPRRRPTTIARVAGPDENDGDDNEAPRGAAQRHSTARSSANATSTTSWWIPTRAGLAPIAGRRAAHIPSAAASANGSSTAAGARPTATTTAAVAHAIACATRVAGRRERCGRAGARLPGALVEPQVDGRDRRGRVDGTGEPEDPRRRRVGPARDDVRRGRRERQRAAGQQRHARVAALLAPRDEPQVPREQRGAGDDVDERPGLVVGEQARDRGGADEAEEHEPGERGTQVGPRVPAHEGLHRDGRRLVEEERRERRDEQRRDAAPRRPARDEAHEDGPIHQTQLPCSLGTTYFFRRKRGRGIARRLPARSGPVAGTVVRRAPPRARPRRRPARAAGARRRRRVARRRRPARGPRVGGGRSASRSRSWSRSRPGPRARPGRAAAPAERPAPGAARHGGQPLAAPAARAPRRRARRARGRGRRARGAGAVPPAADRGRVHVCPPLRGLRRRQRDRDRGRRPMGARVVRVAVPAHERAAAGAGRARGGLVAPRVVEPAARQPARDASCAGRGCTTRAGRWTRRRWTARRSRSTCRSRCSRTAASATTGSCGSGYRPRARARSTRSRSSTCARTRGRASTSTAATTSGAASRRSPTPPASCTPTSPRWTSRRWPWTTTPTTSTRSSGSRRPGFGKAYDDGDVEDRDEVTVALEPLDTGGRYMEYVERTVGTRAGPPTASPASGRRVLDPRAPQQPAFRVAAWADAVRVDKVPEWGTVEVGVPPEAFNPDEARSRSSPCGACSPRRRRAARTHPRRGTSRGPGATAPPLDARGRHHVVGEVRLERRVRVARGRDLRIVRGTRVVVPGPPSTRGGRAARPRGVRRARGDGDGGRADPLRSGGRPSGERGTRAGFRVARDRRFPGSALPARLVRCLVADADAGLQPGRCDATARDCGFHGCDSGVGVGVLWEGRDRVIQTSRPTSPRAGGCRFGAVPRGVTVEIGRAAPLDRASSTAVTSGSANERTGSDHTIEGLGPYVDRCEFLRCGSRSRGPRGSPTASSRATASCSWARGFGEARMTVDRPVPSARATFRREQARSWARTCPSATTRSSRRRADAGPSPKPSGRTTSRPLEASWASRRGRRGSGPRRTAATSARSGPTARRARWSGWRGRRAGRSRRSARPPRRALARARPAVAGAPRRAARARRRRGETPARGRRRRGRRLWAGSRSRARGRRGPRVARRRGARDAGDARDVHGAGGGTRVAADRWDGTLEAWWNGDPVATPPRARRFAPDDVIKLRGVRKGERAAAAAHAARTTGGSSCGCEGRGRPGRPDGVEPGARRAPRAAPRARR